MPQFSVVKILNENNYFVVKTKWCEGMGKAAVKNCGNRRSIQRRIFFSRNENAAPIFGRVEEKFDANTNSCYYGHVIETFGMSFHFSTYVFLSKKSQCQSLISLLYRYMNDFFVW